MSDRYLTWVQSSWGKRISKTLGLPRPTLLRRRGEQDVHSHCLLSAAPDGDLLQPLAQCLTLLPATLYIDDTLGGPLLQHFESKSPHGTQRFGALVLDASGIKTIEALELLHQFFHSHLRQLDPCGRVLILGRPPEQLPNRKAAGRPARTRRLCTLTEQRASAGQHWPLNLRR